MRVTAILLIFGFSCTSFAMNCTELAGKQVLADAAKVLKTDSSQLKLRHIGGESFDGDTTGDGRYKDHSGEYFDVFLKSEDPAKSKALQMYAAGIYIYSDYDSGKILECETYSIEYVPQKDWSDIYETYL